MSQVPSEPVAAPEVSTDELAAALDSEGAFVLDVRNEDEYDEKRLPEATLIPLGELQDRVGEVPTDRTVWVICAVGGRSMRAATFLRGAGIDAVSVGGGTNRWVEEGRPYETGS